jgi:hypothetical protein
MNLLQAPKKERQGMTSIWLIRPPSLREFAKHYDEPHRWRDRPVSDLPGSYAQAASMLVEAMIRTESATRGAAYALLPPYLYLWRHHIELQLKSILELMAEGPPAWEAATGEALPQDLLSRVQLEHSLASLWNLVHPRAETAWERDEHLWHLPGMTPTEVADLVRQLHDIDPNGQGVRYDRGTDGRPTMIGVSRVDLEWAERNMQGIAEFLAWACAEIGAVMRIRMSEDQYQAYRIAEQEAARDDEGL